MSTKILTQAQAEAVYSAMCALNNVGAELKATIYTRDSAGDYMRVYQDGGSVKVVDVIRHSIETKEHYDNQSAFAAAYGMQQG